jgi:hypothetical protein
MSVQVSPVCRRVAAALAVVLLCSTTSSAQYFGRNKVRYKDFRFQILKTEHFDIYFYPSAREGVDLGARLAERWYTRISRILEHQLIARQPLILYASHPDFEQTNVIQGELGEGTGGVTESQRRRIVLPLAGSLADTDHVIGHELVHAFQFDLMATLGSPEETSTSQLPLWFIEGMAEYISLGPVDSNTAMWLRDAAREERLPDVDDLNHPRYFPYRWGQAFWSYVCGRWGDSAMRDMLSVGSVSGDPQFAIERVLGVTTTELSAQWHDAIRSAYGPTLETTIPPERTGRSVVKGEQNRGRLNVGPAISPDGRWIAFLSERSLFSIDLFVADAVSGKVVKQLTSTATDPHYSSLQFIYSAGAWSADSKRLAIATVTGAHPAIGIFAVPSGKKERELPIPSIDEIFNPTWSPDGNAIAFTGVSGGLTDLYVYDLRSGDLRQLTRDPYADLQPAWSPDGHRIAFVTDRFSTRLETLETGPYRLGLIDAVSGRIEPVATFERGKTINPQWAGDGRSLYFLSDRDGVTNLYRTQLGSTIDQLTNISTGLSGITGSSPALSVARAQATAAFSVYDRGNYHIHTLDLKVTPAVAEHPAQEFDRTAKAPAAGTLPPLDRRQSELVRLLSDPTIGLPKTQAYDVTEYRPKLLLDGIGQPSISVGADRFGAALAGGFAAYFSDMLGDHSLATAVQLNSGVSSNFSWKNAGAQAAYLNQSRRWNWGLVGGQVPYMSGVIQQRVGSIGEEPAEIDETIIYRQTDRSVSALTAYPFNRAQRIEFQGGASQISFDRIVETQAFSLRSGELLQQDSREETVAQTLALATGSTALVYDTSVFAVTSPVQGQRYRLEVAPTVGTVNYTSVLLDYRRYLMPIPFYTIAGRALHYGRYGSGSEDDRLFPLFIGYPSLIRGYDISTLDTSECAEVAIDQCPMFSQLTGSRLLVGNLEFRFPLLRPFGAAAYGPAPIEVAVFADGGVAWQRGDRPSVLRGARDGVSSAGVALRANLLGFAVGEFDFARPFQRADHGWVFQFHLTPGF